jgi:hypothetical protein
MRVESGDDLLKALSWVPEGAYRVIIDITVDQPVMVYVQQYWDKDRMTLKPLSELNSGEIVVTRSEDISDLELRRRDAALQLREARMRRAETGEDVRNKDGTILIPTDELR